MAETLLLLLLLLLLLHITMCVDLELRTCILLSRVLLGDAGRRGLRKLELLHHLGGQETHC